MASLMDRSLTLCASNRTLIEDTRVRIALGRRILAGWFGIGGASDTAIPGRVPRWPPDELRHLTRDKIRCGVLFKLRDEKHFAGPANGQVCEVCAQEIHSGNECEIRGPRGFVYAHLLCHRLWYLESMIMRSHEKSAGP